jgi:hypothetical protein
MKTCTFREIDGKIRYIGPFIHYSHIGIKGLPNDEKAFPKPVGGRQGFYVNKVYVKKVIISKNPDEVIYYLTTEENATETGILVTLYVSRQTFTRLQKNEMFNIRYADSYDGSPEYFPPPEMEVIAIYSDENLSNLETSLANL